MPPMHSISNHITWVILHCLVTLIYCGLPSAAFADFEDRQVDREALPPANVGEQIRAPKAGLSVKDNGRQLVIDCNGKPLAEFVYRDPKILRPYMANLRTLSGKQATRNHPPLAEVDATDHDTMHPGIWLAFGDISGHDFWRNRGRMEHVQFVNPPSIQQNQLTFEIESRLATQDGLPLCEMESRIDIFLTGSGWTMVWDATFRSDTQDFVFGDQEELGFGVRVATPITEKMGGQIINSNGKKSAAETWGNPADWCDYAGQIESNQIGIMAMAAPHNFRKSWWHNRDYGLFVANPFGRAAMKQGGPSAVTVHRGESFRITFGAHIHEGPQFDPATAYQDFLQHIRP